MPRPKKPHTVLGVFPNRTAAEDAIRELQKAGFSDSAIGMISRNDKGEVVTEKAGETMAGEGLAAGAIIGAGAGTAVGLGVLAGTIPVIGPVLAVGTLGTMLLNAAAGAAVVGLVGALIGLGIPEEDARFYEDEVKGGRFLVTVDAGERDAEALGILRRCGGHNKMYGMVEPGTANVRPGETVVQPVNPAYPPG
jgi:hypothetical protein